MPEVYDNTDKFTLWYNEVEEGSKKPVYTTGNKENYTLSEISSELRAHVAAGGALEFAAWGFQTNSGKRGLNVKVSKPYVAEGGSDF